MLYAMYILYIILRNTTKLEKDRTQKESPKSTTALQIIKDLPMNF